MNSKLKTTDMCYMVNQFDIVRGIRIQPHPKTKKIQKKLIENPV